MEGVEASEESPRATAKAAEGAWGTEGARDGAAKARLDAGGAHAGLLGGSPLTLLQGIIPGMDSLWRYLPFALYHFVLALAY